MSENCNEIKINNDDIYLIIKQIIKLAYFVIDDYKRIQLELDALAEKTSNFPANV